MPHSFQQVDLQNTLLENNTKKKKKCRGNRRLQHFRRRYRARGMDNQTIEMLVLMNEQKTLLHQNNNNEEEVPALVDNEPMEYFSTVENSFNASTIQTSPPASISLQSMPMQYQWIPPPMSSPTSTFTTIQKPNKKKTKHSRLSVDQWKRSSLKLLPKYHKLPNFLFKCLLCKNVLSCYLYYIEQWLANLQVLQYFRQYAELMCDKYQLQIEQDYWTYVLDLAMPAMTWLSTIVKNIKQRNFINWDYPRTVENVLHRQKIIEKKLIQIDNDINAHRQLPPPPPPPLDEFYEQTRATRISTNDMTHILFKSLNILIQNDLNPFHTHFQQKMILLKFDVKDVHLVKSFYDLNPTQEQVHIFLFSIQHLCFSFWIFFFEILDMHYSKDLANKS